MKRKINKNRATTGRSLCRLVLGAASLFLLTSTSSFGQVATVEAGITFQQYLLDNPEKMTVHLYNQYPENLNYVNIIKYSMILDNPNIASQYTAAEINAMMHEVQNLLIQAEFLQAQADQGISAEAANQAWERQAALNQTATSGSTGGATTGSSATSGTGNSSMPSRAIETPVLTTP